MRTKAPVPWIWLVAVGLVAGADHLQASELYFRHSLFANSAPTSGYYHSATYLVGPSQLEIADGRFPVVADHFHSPPNCLRLKWTSQTGGDWTMTLKAETQYGRSFELQGDTLSLWCYSAEGLTAENAPLIGVLDSRGRGLPRRPLLQAGDSLPAKTWTELRLPLSSFGDSYGGTAESTFDPAKLSQVVFVQRLDDGQPHSLLIDDVRLIEDGSSDSLPPAPPTMLTATGSDSHVDLSWQPSADDDLYCYRVYRSVDGSDFQPLDSTPGDRPLFTDFVGPDQHFQYKVSAIDLANNESPKSPAAEARTARLDDEQLLDMVQRGCFRFYWEGAEPNSGMALEIVPGESHLVALGASGFGIMAQLVATEREFISRDESVERMQKILAFLAKADRYHGVWPHFLDGRTGEVWKWFGQFDNGGDLVETSFLMQGLLAARQYFDRDTPAEKQIRDTITKLWEEVEWDWYRKTPDSELLYWHWSPNHEWHISHPLIGWNETMITYLLAIASPTHGVPASLYYTGWAGQTERAINYRRGWSRTTQGDHYTNGNEYYGIKLDVGCGTGGDLFFAQFSYLGFDPRGMRDRYTNYFRNNRNLTLINRAYCIDNPRGYEGYGPNCWGRSAGINSGGGKPKPEADNGTICCSAALGCFPYTPDESMAVLKHLYRDLGEKVWGVYGFHDGFNQSENWYDEVYMGLNQAQIIVGIENHRTGLVWEKFMANPEIQPMLDAIGFEPDLN